MSYATKDIARALRAAREAKGLSQRELGRKAGVPQGHISRIESGAVDLRVSSLIELARVLDLELALIQCGLRLLAECLEFLIQPVEQRGFRHLGTSSQGY
jgi:transcriptional regulator with XRE-family HTH domain